MTLPGLEPRPFDKESNALTTAFPIEEVQTNGKIPDKTVLSEYSNYGWWKARWNTQFDTKRQERSERFLLCLTNESLWDVVRRVSTAILLVFIRRWGRLFRYLYTLVRCDWCISILIVIRTNRFCSLRGLLCSSPAQLCFLIVGIHASGISSVLSLLMLLGWSLNCVLRNCEGLCISKPYVSVVCFFLSCIALPVSPIYTLPHSHGIL